MDARGDQPGEVRHVDQEDGADGIGNLAETDKVDDTG